jgi:hypothetical protein
MDIGLAKARRGVVLLTPAYITGTFLDPSVSLAHCCARRTLWFRCCTLSTFNDVSTYSAILGGDLASA